MGKGSNTTTSNSTSTSAPDSQAAEYYRQLLARAQGVADTPYQSYTGELTAPVNAQQTAGIDNINQNAGFAQPYIQQAGQMATQAAQPLTAAQIQQYQSPYTQSVVNATQAQFDNQNQQAQQKLSGNAISQGALGGNRVGVAQAELAGQQQLAQAPVIAGLQNQGYQTGLQTALSQQQAQQQGAYSLGNLGVAGQQAALSGAGAQVGAGTLQQSTQQQQDLAAYNQFMQQQAYPFQTTQWLAGLQTGVGSNLGGTSSSQGSSTAAAPNQAAQWAGAGLTAASLFLSDERAKEDITKVGSLNDGQNIYRFRYKGDPKWQIGLIAQEVEKHHPEAVHAGVGNLKMVDVKSATENATSRATGGLVPGFDTGGSAISGTPYAGVAGWVPQLNVTSGGGAPKSSGSAPSAPSAGQSADPMKMAQQAMGIADSLTSGFGSPIDLSAPGGSYTPSGVGDMAGAGQIGGTGIAGLGGRYAAGGHVPRFDDGGGVADTFADRYDAFPQPTTTLADRFDAAYPSMTEADVPNAGVSRSFRASPDPSGGAGAGLLEHTDGGTPPVEGLAPAETVGAPAPALGEPIEVQPVATPAGVAPQTAPAGDMQQYARAISSIESGSAEGDYSLKGPVIKSGDRAYGRYQVMGENVGPWTKAALGRAMTPQEFLDNPEAQDAVFNAQFGKYVDKYGPEGAAKAWFAGEGGMKNPGAKDMLGTSVAGYAAQFNRALGAVGDESVPEGATPTQGVVPAGGIPAPQRGEAGAPTPAQAKQAGFGLGYLSPAAQQALMTAGLGMMASRSPHLGVALGEGGLHGLQAYQGAKASEFKTGIETKRVENEAKRLSEAAASRRDQLAETKRNHQETTRINSTKPVQIGTDSLARPVYGIRNQETGGYNIINSKTGEIGKPVDPAQFQTPGAPQAAAPAEPGSELPAGSAPVEGEAPTGVNDAMLKSLEPEVANTVKAVAEGRISLSQVPTKQRAQITALVTNYKPDFDATQYTTRNAKARQTGEPMSDNAIDLLANRVRAGDVRALQNLGRGSQAAENLNKIHERVAQQATEGKPISDTARSILANAANQMGYQTAERTQAAITAKLSVYGRTAFNAIDIAEKASDAVPRTQFVPANKLINAFKTQTGDPKIVALGQSLMTLTNEYARAIGGGHGTVHDKEEAQKRLNEAQTPEQLRAIMNVMRQEILAEEKALPEARKHIQEIYNPTSAGGHRSVGDKPGATAAPIPAPAAASREVGAIYTTPKGPAKWMGNGWQAVQ